MSVSSSLEIAITRLAHGENLSLPHYASIGAAGLDLYAAVQADHVLRAGEYDLIPTGIAIALPQGFEAQIRPRSGLAFKHGVTVLNAPGTIDSDYRGEVKVLLINHGRQDFVITPAMRIAQMVVARYSQISWQDVKELPQTMRQKGGFGSTGLHEIKPAINPADSTPTAS